MENPDATDNVEAFRREGQVEEVCLIANEFASRQVAGGHLHRGA